MTKDEALKLALEALDCALSENKPYIVQCKKATYAIKDVLEQQEQHRFFCSRCGKRLGLHTVHTCTPPRTFDDYGNKIV